MEPKRSLGQNFFVNQNLAKRIAQEVFNESPDLIVEIGPGQGYFSKIFYEQKAKLLLIEKDDILAKELSSVFPKESVINRDFLDWNFEELSIFPKDKITFFGSLPYNVSKKIIDKIINSEYFRNPCFFIIQKEVAEKYTSSSPNNNYLATKTLLYAKTKKILDISPDSFRPKPKVMSSLIGFYPLKKSYGTFIENKSLEQFDIFLQSAFKQPRKKLLNNLKRYRFKEEQREKILELLERRAQHTSLEDFYLLFSNILSS